MISTLQASGLVGYSGSGQSGYDPDPEVLALREQMRATSGYHRFPHVVQRGQGLSLGDFGTIASHLVKKVRFRSNVTPPIEWDPSAPPSETSGGPSLSDQLGAAGRLVQPAFDIELSTGQVETFAPDGEPTGDYRTLVAVGVGVVGGSLLAAGGIGYLLGRRSRRRR